MACSPALVLASMLCLQSAEMAKLLGERFHETRVAEGIIGQDGGLLAEFWLDAKDRSWTVTIATAGSNLRCILATGSDWQPVLPDDAPPI